MTLRRRALLAAPAVLAAPGILRAQEQRPIRIVVGFAAGGATDITTRQLQPKLSSILGVPILVDNRPGAGGNVATEHVVRSAPDGTTLLMGTIGALAINPTLYRSLPFDPQADLTPITLSGSVLNLLVVPVDRPWRSVADLIAAARARPDTLTYGSSGVGGAGHLGGALLDQMAGIRTVHVPYRGGGPMMTDLISGKTDFSFSTAPTSKPQADAGRLRILGVPTATRSALLPDVPAIAETLPGYEVANWYALLGPKGLAPDFVARMNAAMHQALADPEVRHHLVGHGVEPLPSTPEELARFIREETLKWAPIVRASGATIE